MVTVAPITTSVRRNDSEVRLSREDGVPEPCAVNLDNLTTVPKAKLGPRIISLPPHRMDEVRDALLFALGFD